jgi:hypothetical protein
VNRPAILASFGSLLCSRAWQAVPNVAESILLPESNEGHLGPENGFRFCPQCQPPSPSSTPSERKGETQSQRAGTFDPPTLAFPCRVRPLPERRVLASFPAGKPGQQSPAEPAATRIGGAQPRGPQHIQGRLLPKYPDGTRPIQSPPQSGSSLGNPSLVVTGFPGDYPISTSFEKSHPSWLPSIQWPENKSCNAGCVCRATHTAVTPSLASPWLCTRRSDGSMETRHSYHPQPVRPATSDFGGPCSWVSSRGGEEGGGGESAPLHRVTLISLVNRLPAP